MAFFRRKRKKTTDTKINVEDVYVITARVISSHKDETDCIPRDVNMLFLAKYEDEEYYELFSGKKFKKEERTKSGFVVRTFDTPYVKKAEPLTKYLKDKSKKEFDIRQLFDCWRELKEEVNNHN